MSDLIRGMVQSYLDAFDAYTITSPSLQQEVADFKEKMFAFAGANPDITVFYEKFAQSGLQEEYSALVTRVAMASMGTADEEGRVKTDYSDSPAPPPMSVRDYLEQYRLPYDEIRKAGYRKRAEAAYEKLFEVADRTEDMLDAQIIIEEERLLWKIVSEDSLDLFKPILEAMDPLQPAMTVTLEKHVEIYEKAQSSEELDYALERLEYEKIPLLQRALSKMTLSTMLSSLLLDYCANKLNAQLSGGQGQQGRNALYAMVALRSAIKRTLRFLEEEMGLTFDDLLADEGLKIWMLVPQNADELGRTKEVLNPQNCDVYRDIVRDEILGDLSLLDLLRQTPEKMIWFALKGAAGDAFHSRAVERAEQLNADLTYYRYKEQLSHAAKPHLEPLKGEKSHLRSLKNS